jgi:ParB-like chromosome segregation protein Spo0J|tara:strand:+ start:1202 stop:1768 length:567 start_codon:yes stop_codon:yes gene_type:complete
MISKVETLKVKDCIQDPSNLRRHPERNLVAIERSLKRFGQQKPIVVDADNLVWAGNGTLEAARRLGWETIEVIRTNLSRLDATAFAIADNRTAELADWDLNGLDVTLKELFEQGIDLADIGFAAGDVEDLLGKSTFGKDESEFDGDDQLSYQEKVVILIDDMTVRGPLVAMIQTLVEQKGWQDKISIQ